VLIELRDANNSFMVVDKRAALLLADGTIMDMNQLGNSSNFSVEFSNISAGSYYVSVKARNHLAVVSSSTVALSSGSTASYDFTTASTQAMGNQQMLPLASDVYGLCAGDIDANGIISFADYNAYTDQQTGSTINIYTTADCNLDGNLTTADFQQYQFNASRIGIQQVRY